MAGAHLRCQMPRSSHDVTCRSRAVQAIRVNPVRSNILHMRNTSLNLRWPILFHNIKAKIVLRICFSVLHELEKNKIYFIAPRKPKALSARAISASHTNHKLQLERQCPVSVVSISANAWIGAQYALNHVNKAANQDFLKRDSYRGCFSRLFSLLINQQLRLRDTNTQNDNRGLEKHTPDTARQVRKHRLACCAAYVRTKRER